MKVGVCADIHSCAGLLRRVLTDMDDRLVDERWCLGDLIGEGPDPGEVLELVGDFDLVLRGNHDTALITGYRGEWPDPSRRQLRQLMSLDPFASRHGVDCWHGSPNSPTHEFFELDVAERDLPHRPLGSLGLVAHTHEAMLWQWDGGKQTTATVPTMGQTLAFPTWGAVIANPGAVMAARDDDGARWLEIDLSKRSLTWRQAPPG